MLINLLIYWFTLGNMFLSFYIVLSITLTSETLFNFCQLGCVRAPNAVPPAVSSP